VKILEWASSIEIYVRKLYVSIKKTNKLKRVADATKPLILCKYNTIWKALRNIKIIGIVRR
jgi:hypothetical protein